ncbi:hypothetical protein B9Z19DRAFT_1025472 [Tuber borchii]|uniref:RNA ligase domain-containing protein n=1 Tax=Tuber borchii TaxID=42251 RepID=A0A2T6ZSD6_TUBBO|nr:hypothetical protein B9Z19DRAFT_1025472 [Tuber borchii]
MANHNQPASKTPAFIKYPNTSQFPGFKMEALKIRSGELRAQGPKLALPAKADFRGTVKIHGANISLVFRDCDNLSDVTLQSRNKIMTLDPGNNDNNGAAEFLAGIPFDRLAQSVFGTAKAKFKTLIIAGEFAGKDIHKGVGIVMLEKFFMVFNICIDDLWRDMGRLSGVALPEYRVFNIMNYKTFKVTINLNADTSAVERQIMEYTQEVANACPVAEALGGSGPGEGIVWTMLVPIRHHRARVLGFKTKAEIFLATAYASRARQPTASTSMTQQTKGVADEFVNYAVGQRRLEQGIEYMVEMGIPLRAENVRSFTRWVTNDTLKEEAEQMKAVKAHPTLICVKIGNFAGDWFSKYLQQVNAEGKHNQKQSRRAVD